MRSTVIALLVVMLAGCAPAASRYSAVEKNAALDELLSQAADRSPVQTYDGPTASDYALSPEALSEAYTGLKKGNATLSAEALKAQGDRVLYPPAVMAGYSEESDRFSGTKMFAWKSAPSYGALSPNLFISVGAEGAKDGLVSMSGAFKSWTYLRCNTTYWLADGESVPVAFHDHDGSVAGGGGVIEHVTSLFKAEQLRQIAAASTIEIKICNDEFRLTPTQVSGFRLTINNAFR